MSTDKALEIIVGNYRYSSWSMRGWLAVMHSGLAHETTRVALFTEEGTATLRAKSPSGKAPTLIDYGHAEPITVWDSLAMMDYLTRKAPDAYWWPEAPAAYALARAMSAEMHSGLMALRSACPMNLGVSHKNLDIHPTLQRDIDRVETLWREARTRFGLTSDQPGPFLFGAWSAADIMFAPVVTRFISYGIKLGNVGKAYMAAVNSYEPIDHWYKAAQLEKERIERFENVVPDGKLGSHL